LVKPKRVVPSIATLAPSTGVPLAETTPFKVAKPAVFKINVVLGTLPAKVPAGGAAGSATTESELK